MLNVCVYRLKFGSGTRIKIIEALTLGTIVISSSKGIEVNLKLIKKILHLSLMIKPKLKILTKF